jgi:hypothetical protein
MGHGRDMVEESLLSSPLDNKVSFSFNLLGEILLCRINISAQGIGLISLELCVKKWPSP